MTLAMSYVTMNLNKDSLKFYASVPRIDDGVVAQHSKEDEPCNVSTSCERWTSSTT